MIVTPWRGISALAIDLRHTPYSGWDGSGRQSRAPKPEISSGTIPEVPRVSARPNWRGLRGVAEGPDDTADMGVRAGADRDADDSRASTVTSPLRMTGITATPAMSPLRGALRA